MDKISDNIKGKILKFIDLLELNNIHIQKAILYGSYAAGHNNEYSDIDLALVSDNFSGDIWEDKKLLRKFKAEVSWDLSPMPFRTEEFDNSYFVRDEIIEKGIRII